LEDWSNLTLRESRPKGAKNIDIDVELTKVHVLSETAHARFTTRISTSFAIFIGFLVVFWTLLSENVFPFIGFVVGVTILSAGTFYMIYHTHRTFEKQINKISDMIEAVKKGKELPSLEQLAKGRN
jgi:predicted membrane protein